MLLWATVCRNLTYSPFSCLSFPCQVPDVIGLHLLQPPSQHMHRIGKPLQWHQCCWLAGNTDMTQWEHPTELCSTAPSSLRTPTNSATPWDFLHWGNTHPSNSLFTPEIQHFSTSARLGLGSPPMLELHHEECGLEATINARNVKHIQWSLSLPSWYHRP